MEKKINFFIALLLCATIALAEDVDTTQFTEFGFKGKVKTVTCFYSKEDFGDIVKIQDTIYSFTYDDMGNLLEQQEKKNYFKIYTYYTYDKNRLTTVLSYKRGYYDNYDNIDSTSLNYNENNKIQKKETYVSYYEKAINYDDSLIWKKSNVKVFNYNGDKLIEEKNYNSEGSLTYNISYKYDNRGYLVNKKEINASGYVIFDSSFVYGTTGKIIRDSCVVYENYKYKRLLANKYTYDERGRIKKIDYGFRIYDYWPEGVNGPKKTQTLPRNKYEYIYNTNGNIQTIQRYTYEYRSSRVFNMKDPDKLEGIYKSEETSFKYNNGITSQITKTTSWRKTIYTCDSYGNWIEKRVYKVNDGVDFFEEGIIREITYYK